MVNNTICAACGIISLSHLYSNRCSLQQGAAHINLTDDELLNMHRNSGDSKWLGVLLQRYTVLLLGVALKYLKDKEHAADAVQYVHLKALTSLPAGQISNFKGWLYILMRNYCFQQLRDKRYLQSEEVLTYVPAQDMPDVQTLQWVFDIRMMY